MAGIKKISSFFPILTREQKEILQLLSDQDDRLYREERIASQNNISNISSSLRDIIDIDDNESEELSNQLAEHDGNNVDCVVNIGNAIISGIESLLDANLVSTTSTQTVERQRTKHTKRPPNWQEIAQHHLVYRNVHSTFKKYQLVNFNPKPQHWAVILPRWIEELENKKQGCFRYKPSRECNEASNSTVCCRRRQASADRADGGGDPQLFQ